MNVRLRFLGGAQTVTGSRYLLEIDDFKILIDCGMFQGLKELRLKNWASFPIDPKSIDAVILTHAHIDHTGYLPKLFKEGYRGTVYCTSATRELTEIMLLDSAKLQEEEAEYAFKKGYSKHEKPLPLYTTEDANFTFSYLRGYQYNEYIEVHPKIKIRFHDAGHILGSAITEIFVQGDKMSKKIVFSGDIGKYNKPILRNPSVIKEADILLIESTYGNKETPSVKEAYENFADIILKSIERKGCLLIPAFAVGRTQTLLYYIKQLIDQRKVPRVPVFVDSPMGISVTSLFKRHNNFHTITNGGSDDIFDFDGLHYYRNQSESVAINNIKNGAIIISSSGMCNGGRILHHLYHRLSRPNDTLLFVGYQSEGTRGRRLLDGEPSIRIFGEEVQVKCHLEQISGLSAHADRAELFKWLANFKSAPKMTFIVHGEPEVSKQFSHAIQNKLGWNSTVPNYMEAFELFKGI
ncbi:MAG TPA: MBL fold metallo-hydrolase [Cytophagales bacterium]|nr:MBL fold metallo-hydrolase [Cytophagales bacterium]